MAIPYFSQLADGDDSVAGVPQANAAGVSGASSVNISEVRRKVNGQSNKDMRLRGTFQGFVVSANRRSKWSIQQA